MKRLAAVSGYQSGVKGRSDEVKVKPVPQASLAQAQFVRGALWTQLTRSRID